MVPWYHGDDGGGDDVVPWFHGGGDGDVYLTLGILYPSLSTWMMNHLTTFNVAEMFMYEFITVQHSYDGTNVFHPLLKVSNLIL